MTIKNVIPRYQELGFTMVETMIGTHTFFPGFGPSGVHPMHFEVTWGSHDILQWLNPIGSHFLVNFLEGTVSVGGLVKQTICRGSLDLMYFTQAKIRYIFEFSDSRKNTYRYVGEKIHLRPWNIHRTHTTCYGVITDLKTNQPISKSVLRFDLHTLPAFIGSFRFHLQTSQ